MPHRGNKSKNPTEQKRRGGHVDEGLEKRGIQKTGQTKKEDSKEPPNKGGMKQGPGGGSAF